MSTKRSGESSFSKAGKLANLASTSSMSLSSSGRHGCSLVLRSALGEGGGGVRGGGGRKGKDGGWDALDDGRELAYLRAVDGSVALEELPHLDHRAQGLRDLGHHDPHWHKAASVTVRDEGDLALGVVVDRLQVEDIRDLAAHEFEVGAVVDLGLFGERVARDDELASRLVFEVDVSHQELPERAGG
jgi:hypothetical protein